MHDIDWGLVIGLSISGIGVTAILVAFDAAKLALGLMQRMKVNRSPSQRAHGASPEGAVRHQD